MGIHSPFVEVETNATVIPSVEFDRFVTHYTCSPKLSNSGMAKERRYREEVLRVLSLSRKSVFKFVIEDKEDQEEVMKDFVTKFNIPPSRVYLMPESTDRKELDKKSAWVVEICKRHGFNFSSRLHISIWDELTGV